ncbi:MAG: PspC domain-containing protein [Chloroflexota bacterium]
MQTKRLYRSTRERMIGGVCAGLADYLGMDATVIRLIFLLLFFMAGNGLLIYLIMWLIVPEEPSIQQ